MIIYRSIKLYLLAIVCVFLTLGLILEIKYNTSIKVINNIDAISKERGDTDNVLYSISHNLDYESNDIDLTALFLRLREDTSDFKTPSIIKLLYDYKNDLDDKDYETLKNTLLNYKYWITDPGEDSQVYWSENHQILGASAEYLAGQLFPNEVFTNSGLYGHELMLRGKKRIEVWLELRWKYGFTEWYSNTYYKEDIAPLSNIIQFTKDSELKTKATIIMDLILYDIASQSFKGTFISTSGRAYENDRKNDVGSTMEKFLKLIYGESVDLGPTMLQVFFLNNEYIIPEIFKDIIKEPGIIRASTGLSLSELKNNDLIGHNDKQIMMQWGMESFTNPEVINNSISYIKKHNLFNNKDLNSFKLMNYQALIKLNLLPILSKILNLQENGISIQRANTYTYKTNNYMMYTAQEYFPGTYGDQHHVFGVTLRNDLTVFHTHSALEEGERGLHGNSPSYWVGYGRIPHTAQYKNVNLSIYKLPKNRSIMEKDLLTYTHAWFPSKLFDFTELDGKVAFAKIDNTYIALIGRYDLEYKDLNELNDLIQNGRTTYWITELSDSNKESFFDFKNRIIKQSKTIDFMDGKLIYNTDSEELSLIYNKGFWVNGIKENHEYNRFESPWIQSDRDPKELNFKLRDRELYLNFKDLIRSVE